MPCSLDATRTAASFPPTIAANVDRHEDGWRHVACTRHDPRSCERNKDNPKAFSLVAQTYHLRHAHHLLYRWSSCVWGSYGVLSAWREWYIPLDMSQGCSSSRPPIHTSPSRAWQGFSYLAVVFCRLRSTISLSRAILPLDMCSAERGDPQVGVQYSDHRGQAAEHHGNGQRMAQNDFLIGLSIPSLAGLSKILLEQG